MNSNKKTSRANLESRDNTTVNGFEDNPRAEKAKRQKTMESDYNDVEEDSAAMSYASVSTTASQENIDSESAAESSLNTTSEVSENLSQDRNNSMEVEQPNQDQRGKITDEQDKTAEMEQKQSEEPETIDLTSLVDHDPGERVIRNSQDRERLIKLGPYQPLLRSYPRNDKITKKGPYRFNAAWFKKYNFLEYSVVKDAAFCFVCSLFPDGPDRTSFKSKNWSSKGVRRWDRMNRNKRNGFKVHCNSKAHKAALEDYQHFIKENERIDVMLLKQIQNEKDRMEAQSQSDELSDEESE